MNKIFNICVVMMFFMVSVVSIVSADINDDTLLLIHHFDDVLINGKADPVESQGLGYELVMVPMFSEEGSVGNGAYLDFFSTFQFNQNFLDDVWNDWSVTFVVNLQYWPDHLRFDGSNIDWVEMNDIDVSVVINVVDGDHSVYFNQVLIYENDLGEGVDKNTLLASIINNMEGVIDEMRGYDTFISALDRKQIMLEDCPDCDDLPATLIIDPEEEEEEVIEAQPLVPVDVEPKELVENETIADAVDDAKSSAGCFISTLL